MSAQHPDLIDAEGERWHWSASEIDGKEGYRDRQVFCRYDREFVEREFGPITEVPPEPADAYEQPDDFLSPRAVPVGASVVVTSDAPIHAGSRGEVVEIDPAGYDGMTHRVQLANYWLWFRPRHLKVSRIKITPGRDA